MLFPTMPQNIGHFIVLFIIFLCFLSHGNKGISQLWDNLKFYLCRINQIYKFIIPILIHR